MLSDQIAFRTRAICSDFGVLLQYGVMGNKIFTRIRLHKLKYLCSSRLSLLHSERKLHSHTIIIITQLLGEPPHTSRDQTRGLLSPGQSRSYRRRRRELRMTCRSANHSWPRPPRRPMGCLGESIARFSWMESFCIEECEVKRKALGENWIF